MAAGEPAGYHELRGAVVTSRRGGFDITSARQGLQGNLVMRVLAQGTLAALVAIAGCTTVPRKSELTLQQQVDRHVAAITGRDLSEIEATITRDSALLLILPSGTMTRTRADYVAFHEKLFAAKEWTMTLDLLHLQQGPGYGHALYRVTFDVDGDGPASGQPAYLALGFRLEAGEWRLVHDQNTPIRQ